MKPLAPNTLLQNRYLIVHLIGKGGMGEVYLAVDQRLGSAIALKRTFYAGDEQLANAFEREARTLARLRHAVLPKVSDHFVENENQFLVMEHISGDDLSKRLITTQKPFPLSWVLFWADQLLDALAYLHSHEPPIIHRDIKPQNLKLTDENNIVLLDFGLSKNSVTQPRDSSGSSNSSSVVGYTPHYAPMEQIRGTGTNPRSDIYSLSATLYQLLTNIVPPDALTRADQIIAGNSDPIQPISEINPEIPRPISDVILKGMSVSQEHRYPNAREMQKVLREAYANLQTQMAEKTIALNAQGGATAQDVSPLPSTQQKTEQYLPSVAGNPLGGANAEIGAQTIPYGFTDNSGYGASGSENAFKTEQIQDFDATVRLDSQEELLAAARQEQQFSNQNYSQNNSQNHSQNNSQNNSAPPTDVYPANEAQSKQSGIKTEVYMPGGFETDDYAPKNDTGASPQNYATENYHAGGNQFSSNENFASPTENFSSPNKNFTGDQTTPFSSYDNQDDASPLEKTQAFSGFEFPAETGNSAPLPQTQFQADDYSSTRSTPDYERQPQYERQEEPVQEPIPSKPQTSPSEEKNSNGMMFAIVGAIFAFFVLAAGAAGLGWYLMQETDKPNITNVSTPTPEPTTEVTPTPEPTAEVTPDVANTNVNTDVANTDVANTENVSNTANTQSQPTTEKTQTTQQQQQQQQQKNPVRTTNPENPPVKNPPVKNPPVKNPPVKNPQEQKKESRSNRIPT